MSRRPHSPTGGSELGRYQAVPSPPVPEWIMALERASRPRAGPSDQASWGMID